MIDARSSTGWNDLRQTLAAGTQHDFRRLVLATLGDDLHGAHDDCLRFFETLFTLPAHVSTIRVLARMLDVHPSTLMSRFFRLRLPPPKRYLALARLVRAARLFENSGLSVANVANALDYSSPQSFGRHVRTLLGLTAAEFRRRHDGESVLRHFRDELVTPYRETLRTFSPLGRSPRAGS